MSRKQLVSFVASLLLVSAAHAANFVAGNQYIVLPQPQPTNVAPGKVEVMEVFSYGCPACNAFQSIMKRLRAGLPANAQLVYLPASWHPEEDWHVFQRAFLTAQSLGVAEKAHDAMFEAVWSTGELAVSDPRTGRTVKKLPTIDDVARFYERVTGVKAADFLATAKSFGVDTKMRQADSQIIAMQVGATPTLVVNGKYRINAENLSSNDEFAELVKFLVAKESAPAAPAGAKKK